MRSRWAICAIASTGVCAGVLLAVQPEIDLEVARFFRDYCAADTESALYRLANLVRGLNHFLTFAVFVPPAAALILKLCRPRLPMLLPTRATLLLLLSLLVGPGLLVNGVLKEHWARPRPGEVIELDGTLAFKAWWDPTGDCPSNCSFASGESASAFALLALAAVVPAPWSVPAVAATVGFAALVGFGRIAVTGHFVSDVVLAAVLTSLIVWLFHGLLFRWPLTRTTDHEAEAWLAGRAEAGRQTIASLFARLGAAAASPQAPHTGI
jgi:lipid A 4'-phosphatase